MRVTVLTCTSPLQSSAAHGSSRQPAAACRSLPQPATASTACCSLPQPAAVWPQDAVTPLWVVKSLPIRVFSQISTRYFATFRFLGRYFEIFRPTAPTFSGERRHFHKKKQAKNVQKGLRIPQIPQPAAASTACRSQAIVRLLSPTLRGVTISQLIFGFLGVIFDGESVPVRA